MRTSNSKQRLFEIMGRVDKSFKPKLNEGAFNDAGEPLMTHNQYRDYSEPSEPEYDDSRGNYEEEQSSESIVKEIEKHFNTILESYNGREYGFLTKGTADLNIYFNNNTIFADAQVDTTENKFPKQNVDELNVDELIQFFEPYRQYILAGEEAERQMNNISKQNSADARYASQERAATGGLGENIHNTAQMGGVLNSKGTAGYNPDTSKQDAEYAASVRKANPEQSKIGEGNSAQTINPKYTHFALTNDTDDIVNGWDYSEIEPAELRKFKNDYFFKDLTDMGINPHGVHVVTTSYLKRSGVNPFDVSNWKQ